MPCDISWLQLCYRAGLTCEQIGLIQFDIIDWSFIRGCRTFCPLLVSSSQLGTELAKRERSSNHRSVFDCIVYISIQVRQHWVNRLQYPAAARCSSLLMLDLPPDLSHRVLGSVPNSGVTST